MLSYRAYGLGFHSDIPLPDMAQAPAPADVIIRRMQSSPVDLDRLAAAPPQKAWKWINRDEAVLAHEKIGVLLLRKGQEILYCPAESLPESTVRLILLSAVMAVLLYQRGRLVLHASAVRVNGGAAAFMGASGWGKSSMAATLVARGHEFLTDDVTAIEVCSGAPLVYPSFPHLKLTPEVASTLGHAEEVLVNLGPHEIKQGLRFDRPISLEAVPIRRVYVLDESTENKITSIPSQEVIMELIRHSYPTKLLQPGDALHLSQCAQLGKLAQVKRLSRILDLAAIDRIAEMVEEDMANESRNTVYD